MGKYEIVRNRIQESLNEYKDYYKAEKIESDSILEYGENAFFGGKKEAYEDILEFMEELDI